MSERKAAKNGGDRPEMRATLRARYSSGVGKLSLANGEEMPSIEPDIFVLIVKSELRATAGLWRLRWGWLAGNGEDEGRKEVISIGADALYIQAPCADPIGWRN